MYSRKIKVKNWCDTNKHACPMLTGKHDYALHNPTRMAFQSRKKRDCCIYSHKLFSSLSYFLYLSKNQESHETSD